MEFVDILDDVYKLPAASKDRLVRVLSEQAYPKGYHLFFAHQRVDKFYFLKSGICRAYMQREDLDVTFWFAKEGDIIFPLQTRYDAKNTYESVELLEDCVFYEIDIATFESFLYEDIHIANWARISMERHYIQMEKALIARQFKTSTERYNELLISYPSITQRVSLKVIASYLGITSVNLSRIRAKIKR